MGPGADTDAILQEWHEKLRGLFGSGKPRAAFFVTVGAKAVWRAQAFG
jgi:hypothetical protein